MVYHHLEKFGDHMHYDYGVLIFQLSRDFM